MILSMTRRAFLATPVLFALKPESPHDARIREAVTELEELIRPRPRAFQHYNVNKFDIYVAAAWAKITIKEAGFPVHWRQHYRVACAVAKDMTHAEWECYPGCRHWREHYFAWRCIDADDLVRYQTEIVS